MAKARGPGLERIPMPNPYSQEVVHSPASVISPDTARATDGVPNEKALAHAEEAAKATASARDQHPAPTRSLDTMAVLEVVVANIVTVLVFALLYSNLRLFQDYLVLALGAVLLGLAFTRQKRITHQFLVAGFDSSNIFPAKWTTPNAELLFLVAAFCLACFGSPTSALLLLVLIVGALGLAFLVLVTMRLIVRLNIADAHALAALAVILTSVGFVFFFGFVSLAGIAIDFADSATKAVTFVKEETARRGFQASEMMENLDTDQMLSNAVEQVESRLHGDVIKWVEANVPPQVAFLAAERCKLQPVLEKSVSCRTVAGIYKNFVATHQEMGTDAAELKRILNTLQIGEMFIPIPNDATEATVIARDLAAKYGPVGFLDGINIRVPTDVSDAWELVKEIYDVLGPRGILEQLKKVLGYFEVSSLSDVRNILAKFFEASGDITTRAGSYLLALLTGLFSLLSSSADLAENVVVFFGIWFFVLSRERDVVTSVVNSLPLPENVRTIVRADMEAAVQTLFWSRVRAFASNAVLTYLLFTGLNLNFEFLASILAGAAAVVTILPDPYVWTALFGLPQLIIARYWIQAVLLVGVHFLFNYVVDDDEPEGFEGASNLIAFSAVLGTSVFGSQGAAFGPLLVYVLLISYKVFGVLAKVDSQSQ